MDVHGRDTKEVHILIWAQREEKAKIRELEGTIRLELLELKEKATEKDQDLEELRWDGRGVPQGDWEVGRTAGVTLRDLSPFRVCHVVIANAIELQFILVPV